MAHVFLSPFCATYSWPSVKNDWGSIVVPLLHSFFFFSLCRSCAWKTYVNVKFCSFMKRVCKRDVYAIVLRLLKCLCECSEQLSLHRSLSVQVWPHQVRKFFPPSGRGEQVCNRSTVALDSVWGKCVERYAHLRQLLHFGKYFLSSVFVFSHQPCCSLSLIAVFASAWITRACCSVYIIYFLCLYVNVLFVYTISFFVICVPLLHIVAWHTLRPGVLTGCISHTFVCAVVWNQCYYIVIHMHYLVTPLVESTACCELGALMMFRVFLLLRLADQMKELRNAQYCTDLQFSKAKQLLVCAAFMQADELFFSLF